MENKKPQFKKEAHPRIYAEELIGANETKWQKMAGADRIPWLSFGREEL
jgi:hypothetical protein